MVIMEDFESKLRLATDLGSQDILAAMAVVANREGYPAKYSLHFSQLVVTNLYLLI